MSPTPTADQQRLAGDLWLAFNDGLGTSRSALPPLTRGLALAGALLVELVDLNAVGVTSAASAARHRVGTADAHDALSLYVIPVRDRPVDPADVEGYDARGRAVSYRPSKEYDQNGRPFDSALAEVYDSIVRESGAPADPRSREPVRDQPLPYTGTGRDGTYAYPQQQPVSPVPGHRMPGGERQPSWTVPTQRTPTAAEFYPRQDAAPRRDDASTFAAAEPVAGVELRLVLDGWAIEGRAETLVINRLLATGLVKVERVRRFFGGDKQVITPVDSVISGRPITRITGGLRSSLVHIPRAGLDPNRPRGLTSYDKRLAGLFAAAGLFDIDRTRLGADEMALLRKQMQTDVPPAVAMLLRQINITIKSLALNR